MEEWVPPVTRPEEYERLTAIEDGIPIYIRVNVNGWIEGRFEARGRWLPEVIDELAARMKRIIPRERLHFRHYIGTRSEPDLVNIVDCILFHRMGNLRGSIDYLSGILDHGRAGWQLTLDEQGRFRMTRRIPDGVRVAFMDVMNKTALAGRLLMEAFEHAYGAHPNPGHSYMQSVKAVETLACPRFLPDNNRATLGRVIAHLNGKRLSLPLKEKDAPHGETTVRMMQLLWQGADRHGGQEDYEDVSVEGARTAHTLAVALVQLLHEQLVTQES